MTDVDWLAVVDTSRGDGPSGQVLTEGEWLSAIDPTPMLEFIRDRTSDRKLRLAGCGCGRRVLPLLRDVNFALVLSAGERLADDEPAEVAPLLASIQKWMTPDSPEPEFHGSAGMALVAATPPLNRASFKYAFLWLANAIAWGTSGAVYNGAGLDSDWPADPAWRATWAAERRQQAAIMQDVYGNPFHSIAFETAWRTSTVTALARQMYDSRDFTAMPILADALQDSGCADEQVLNHCRGPGPHCRGCWVVDLALGKE